MRLYYIRHGLTDWNQVGRLQGHRDTPINQTGREQAARSGDILRDLLAREGRAATDLAYVSSPLSRARETMEIARCELALPRAGYAVDARLSEIAFGEWEGLTYAEVMQKDPDIVARREGDKWGFVPPGGENYEMVAARVGAWYASLTHDTVATAHGGTGRALVAYLGLAAREEAMHQEIDQGVVYVFADNTLARYG
jgi:probable phosphoglycerate mutase